MGLWASLAAVTLILAYLGWLDRGRAAGLHGFAAHENAAFMAIRAFGLGEAYLEPEKIGHDWRLIAARWAGLAVFAGALSAAGVAVFGAQRAAWNAARAKGHTLIVGDHEMARALARVGPPPRGG